MNTSNPQISLAALAQAVKAHDGTQIDPDSKAGQERLLEIANELLEDPVKGQALLRLLSKFEKRNHKRPEPWAHKGQVRYLDTSEIVDENDFLLDDIDHLRVADIFGRPLEKVADGEHEELSHDVILTSKDRGWHVLASPDLLGFKETKPSSTFDRRALRSALTQAHKDLRHAVQNLTVIISSAEATSEFQSTPASKRAEYKRPNIPKGIWKIQKTIRAENFHELTVSRAKKHIYVGYIGSGDDLFLKVTIDDKEIVKTQESLRNFHHLSSIFLDTLSSDPEAGVVIVSSLLEELTPLQSQEFES